ncbi:DUF427 domain-containing protein [Streptomyces sp. NPDC059373]
MADIRWEPSERWVRGTKDGITVVDSRRPLLVWEPGRPVPGYAFPEQDVRTDLLRKAERPPPTGRHAGAGVFYDLAYEGVSVGNAAWTYPGEELAGHIAFEWFGRKVLDHWYEEEEEIFVHPRDPHKRVDAIRSGRHVRVEIGGTLVAETRRPVLLFETGLPTRYYIPREDVRFDLLTPTGLRTGCPYKGTAQYWSWSGGGETAVPANVAWSYAEPLPAVGGIAGHVAFYNEAVDIVVDGERPTRPVTVFSERLRT